MFSADKPLPPPPLLPKPRNDSAAAQSSTYRNRPTLATKNAVRNISLLLHGVEIKYDIEANGNVFLEPMELQSSGFSAARAMFEAAQRPEVRQAAISASKDSRVRAAVTSAAKDEKTRQFVLNAFMNPQNREVPRPPGTTNPSSTAPSRPAPVVPKPALVPSQTMNIGGTAAVANNAYSKPTPAIPPPPPKQQYNFGQSTKTTSNLYPSISAELASLNLSSPSTVKQQTKSAPVRPPPPRSKSHSNLVELETGPHALVKYPYNSAHADELTCQVGDTVLLKKEVDSQWVYAMNARTGAHGIVPIAFLDIKIPLAPTARLGGGMATSQTYDSFSNASQSYSNTWHQPLQPLVTSYNSTRSKSATPSPPKTGLAAISNVWGRRLRARYDYFSNTDGDLSFEIYDEILVKERIGEEWLYGECKGKAGIFPANFVESGWETLPMRAGTDASKKPAIRIVTAAYDYDSDVPEDLRFKKGDIIEVIEDLGAEWVRGRLWGVEGLVPTTYLANDAIMVSPRYGSAAVSPTGNTGGYGSSGSSATTTVTAIEDYHTGEADHLYFSKGDQIIVTEWVNDQWGRGKPAEFKTLPAGLFPRSHVK